jgi:hypothetical protein
MEVLEQQKQVKVAGVGQQKSHQQQQQQEQGWEPNQALSTPLESGMMKSLVIMLMINQRQKEG